MSNTVATLSEASHANVGWVNVCVRGRIPPARLWSEVPRLARARELWGRN